MQLRGRITPRSISWSLGLFAIVLLAIFASGRARSQTPPEIPKEILSQALSEFQAAYGPVKETYGVARSTLDDWGKDEPNNTSGLDKSSEKADTAVWAIFVSGDFVVEGPPPSWNHGNPIISTYSSGRLVVDETGDVLSVQLWTNPRSADTPFGETFDD